MRVSYSRSRLIRDGTRRCKATELPLLLVVILFGRPEDGSEAERAVHAGGELDLGIRAQLRLLSPGYALNQALLAFCGRSSQKSVSQVLLVWFTVLSYLFSAAVLVGLPICV